VFPNAAALALADHPDRAGSASALVGLSQYLFGAAAAPLVGVAGTGTAVPMAVVIAVSSAAAVAAYRVLAGAPLPVPP
jgi:MFS transporter, DHA1 family, multidrug resistance protein